MDSEHATPMTRVRWTNQVQFPLIKPLPDYWRNSI